MTSRRQDRSLTRDMLSPLVARLRAANAATARAWPGDRTDRQPIHTVYGGAHLFKSDTASRLGAIASAMLDEYAPDASAFGAAFGLQPDAAYDSPASFNRTVRERVREKLAREPVEDFRIDFEDGYGIRPDAEEDTHAQAAAEQVAIGMDTGTLPPFIGIRIKPLSAELHARSLRTLDIFITTLTRVSRRRLPPGFVVTIPKLMSPVHVSTVARACASLERATGLRPGALRLELMIETPQSVVAADGTPALPRLIAAGGNRVTALHFGAYDYTALCGVTAAWQNLRHPACDFARHMMQVATAQTGIWLSDGATTVLPIVPHKPIQGARLTRAQRAENRAVVHRAWKLHVDDTQHSLAAGFYQGWDLHPGQLPSRYAAVYAFFLAARRAATDRLRNFVEKAARASLVGDVFDDAATGQGLVNFFVRGLSCGALTLAEAQETGLTVEELRTRSFVKILELRRSR